MGGRSGGVEVEGGRKEVCGWRYLVDSSAWSIEGGCRLRETDVLVLLSQMHTMILSFTL